MIAPLARLSKPKASRPYWTAPIFAAALSLITLGGSFLVTPHSYEVGLPAFFCFLPMAFYFSAAAQVESQKQVRALQQRIEQLEAQAAPRATVRNGVQGVVTAVQGEVSMSRSTLKNTGIGLSVLCFVLLFVAVERYQANAASVAAMNQMMQASPFGQNAPFGLSAPFGQAMPLGHMTPGVPAITTYAVLFAILSAAGAVTCFIKVGARPSAA